MLKHGWASGSYSHCCSIFYGSALLNHNFLFHKLTINYFLLVLVWSCLLFGKIASFIGTSNSRSYVPRNCHLAKGQPLESREGDFRKILPSIPLNLMLLLCHLKTENHTKSSTKKSMQNRISRFLWVSRIRSIAIFKHWLKERKRKFPRLLKIWL